MGPDNQQADKGIELAQKFAQVTLDQISTAVFWADASARFVEVNAAACRLLGYTREELLQVTVHDLDLNFPVAERKRRFAQIKTHGGELFETRMRTKDGRELDVEVQVGHYPVNEVDYFCGVVHDITAHKQAEAALRESEERLQLAQSAAKMGTFDWDIAGGKVLWSPQTERLWGLPVSGFEGTYEHWRRLVHPDDLPNAEALAQQALTNPTLGYEFEHRIICPDGALRWIFAKAITVCDAAGKPVRMVGINMDITDRKQAEIALQASERRHRAVLERGTELVTLVDATGKVVTESPNVTAILGHPAGSFVGREIRAMVHPEERGAVDAVLRELVATPGCSRRLEARTQTADDRWLWLDTVATNLLDDPAVHAIVLNSRDITMRKRLEVALRESEEWHRAVFQGASVGILIADTETRRFVYANEAICRMLGYTVAELARMTVADIHPRDSLPLVLEEFAAQAGGKKLVSGLPCLRKDGTVFPVDINAVAMQLGGRTMSVGFFTDISERKAAEEALRLSQERFRQIIESVPMLAWQCNEKGEAQYCNRRWYEYTGEGPEKTLGDMWQKALHPDDEQRIHDETNRTAATGDPYNVEYRLRRHDGQYRWHVARAVPVRDSTGKIVIWVGCAADIEDQKQAEATLIRFTSKLERQVRERTRELQTVANDLHREVAQRTKLENQLLEVSEQEQRRIGQDLHDGVGQRLAAVRFLSAGLSKRLGHGHHPAARRTRGLGLSSMRYRAALIGATFAIRRGKHGGTVVTCGWTPAGKRLHGGRDAR